MSFKLVKKLPKTAKTGEIYGLKVRGRTMGFQKTAKKGFGSWKITKLKISEKKSKDFSKKGEVK